MTRRDRVTYDTREFVLDRDRECVLAKLDKTHACRDQWGSPHPSWQRDRATLEHVKDAPRIGKRAPSDPAHLVWLCASANLRPPTKEQRAMFREYLAKVTA